MMIEFDWVCIDIIEFLLRGQDWLLIGFSYGLDYSLSNIPA